DAIYARLKASVHSRWKVPASRPVAWIVLPSYCPVMVDRAPIPEKFGAADRVIVATVELMERSRPSVPPVAIAGPRCFHVPELFTSRISISMVKGPWEAEPADVALQL